MTHEVSVSSINMKIRELSSALNSEPSATKVLNRWCFKHGFSDREKSIVAIVKKEPQINPSSELVRDLGVDIGAEVSFRSGHLVCRGPELILSDVNLWWVRERIPEDMQRVLDDTDRPFGEVISALEFKRIPQETDIFQISDRVEHGAETIEFCDIPCHIITNTAILMAAGRPICFITENYRKCILYDDAGDIKIKEGAFLSP
jgi:hypothetical protein